MPLFRIKNTFNKKNLAIPCTIKAWCFFQKKYKNNTCKKT
ncbi:hypothetical protein SPONL_154 [uncultured Candidatus Thioglobus sp.]|nr:hypothetical protein SPONL_154 [uncultured Candidatus Thioglobus sp.]